MKIKNRDSFVKKLYRSNLGLANMKDKYITVPKKNINPVEFFGNPPLDIKFFDKSLNKYFLFPFKKENNGEYRLSKFSNYFSIKEAEPDDEVYIVKVLKSDNKAYNYYIDLKKRLKYKNKQEILLYPEEESVQTSDVKSEGSRISVIVNKYERNKEARELCIKHWKAICAVCELEFNKIYGKIGNGFIHVHHLKPISLIGKSYIIDPTKDLVPVCPNCHSMIHRKNPPFTIQQMKKKLLLK